ncbi:MAG: efflux RND transporter periplasmic adaptor subunit [Pseudomonadota bacterium]
MRPRLLVTVFLICAAAVSRTAQAEAPVGETLIFEGRVEALQRAELSSRLDGVVAEILFTSGDQVSAGQPMILLDRADQELALAVADANLAAAQAELEGATREAARQERLAARGFSPDAVVGPVRTAKAAAEAAVALAEAERRIALLALERTTIRAPIAGYVGPPLTAVGAFLEAESGAALARIVALDPVMVAYKVPYGTRLATMSARGADTVDALFDRIEITLTLPGGAPYPYRAKPDHTSAEVDPTDGTITVRTPIKNPGAVLRPGMAITVASRIAPVTTHPSEN